MHRHWETMPEESRFMSIDRSPYHVQLTRNSNACGPCDVVSTTLHQKAQAGPEAVKW